MAYDWSSITPLTSRHDDLDSPWFMPAEMFQDGIAQLVADGELVLPYGVQPGSHPGGIATAVLTSWSRWRYRYQWNPPLFLAHLPEYAVPDPDASEKPRWQTVRTAAFKRRRIRMREDAKKVLDREAERRIRAVYGARDNIHEIRLRLAGRHTPEQDAERERLIARHDALVRWVNDDARTDAELEAFDATDDSRWQ